MKIVSNKIIKIDYSWCVIFIQIDLKSCENKKAARAAFFLILV